MRRIILLVVLCLMCVPVVSAQRLPSHGLTNQLCTRSDGTTIYANYNYRTDLLALRNRQTGAVELEIERFRTRYITLKLWSENCRYLFGQVENGYAVWDTVSGGRAFFNSEIPLIHYPGLRWAVPGYILIAKYTPGHSVRDLYLWDISNHRTLTLIKEGEQCNMYDLQWDTARSELWMRFQCIHGRPEALGEVRGYSLHDGSLIGRYRSLYEGIVEHRISDDKQYVTIAPYSSDYVMVYRRDGTLLGNLHTYHTYLPNHALSPDGRFYVVAQNQIRVWDLTALNADTSIPNYTWEASDSVILSVKFVDNVTVEVTLKGNVIQRWNILTGTQIL